jgi:RNA polymerase sigma-70 factor (ECF subfamily)
MIRRSMRRADFDRVYSEHAQAVYAFLAYRTGDRILAQDLLADTFEAALRARRLFDRTRGSERTWLMSIALNRLRDHARRRSAEARAYERVSAGEPPGPGHGLEAVADRDYIMRALAVLSEEERECLALRFGADLTLKEIAAALGVPESTVEGRVYRGLRKLRDELA